MRHFQNLLIIFQNSEPEKGVLKQSMPKQIGIFVSTHEYCLLLNFDLFSFSFFPLGRLGQNLKDGHKKV